MTDIWNERAEAYRTSQTHASGDDLDLVVEWCEPVAGVTVLDVATGGGHVARRLREAGAEVVTTDAAPGMQPDVVAPADHLPFADASFDVVACRIAVHHFPDALAAVEEMARVARRRVVIVGQHVHERERRGGRPSPRPEPRPQLRRPPSGTASSSSPGSRSRPR